MSTTVPTIIPISEFDPKKVIYGATYVPLENPDRIDIPIGYPISGRKEHLYIQLKPCRMSFNVSDFMGDKKYCAYVTIDDASTIEKMNALDASNLAHYFDKLQRASTWKTIRKQTLEELKATQIPSLKPDKYDTLLMKIRICLDIDILQMNSEGERTKITSPTNTVLNLLCRGAIIQPTIRANAVWIHKRGLGCIWEMIDAVLVTPAPVSIYNSLFLDDESSDDEPPPPPPPPPPCIGMVKDVTLLTDMCLISHDLLTLETAYRTQCKHLYDRETIQMWWKTKGKKECPYCKEFEPACPCISCK